MATSVPAGAAPGLFAAAPPPLPRLREDIKLLPGPRSADGSRSWLLHDPVRNVFFQIGWREFQILSQWKGSSLDSIVDSINRGNTLTTDPEEVGKIARFMTDSELVLLAGPDDRAAWTRRIDGLRNKSFSRLFQENLFLRVPLLNPDRFLTATAGLSRIFFSRGFWALTLVAAIVALILVARQWDHFISTFPYFFSIQGMLIYGAALTFAKVIHELGHAYAAKRHGLRVPSMGVAFLVLWPVLFTDTTDSWRLRWGHQRFVVAGAGMAAEIGLAAWALLLWTVVPPGPLQSALFALATATWILTLVVNLNPLIRFDGYFLLSDALGLENLQPRAFGLLRHKFRRICLGLSTADPEPALSDNLRRGMLLYALGALIYRVVLALGIGLLLYYFAFKLLGIFALATVVVVMLFQPLFREIRSIFTSGDEMLKPARLIVFGGVLLALAGLVFYPWQGTVSAPAIRKTQTESRVYTPVAARLVTVDIASGDTVRKGQKIAVLESPEIEFRLKNAAARIDSLRLVADRIRFRQDIADQEAIARQQLAKAIAEQSGYQAQLDALTLRAPFDGAVGWISSSARPGAWVRPSEPVALLIDPRKSFLTAYLQEDDLARVRPGSDARFYAFGVTDRPVAATIRSIAPSAAPTIRDTALASIYGGPIAARAGENGTALPEGGLYEVRLQLSETLSPSGREQTGIVKISAEPESFARRIWRQVRSVMIRESGF